MRYDELVLKALEAREQAYAPYSNFKVGAALITEGGAIYTGCNIENASFGATNCAERTAIFKAVSEGRKVVEAIAITGDPEAYTYPCGICRQVIAEFAVDENIEIILARSENDYIVKKLSELLPGAFTKRDLNL